MLDCFIEQIQKEKFEKVSIEKILKELKNRFSTKELWHTVIMPTQKADELYEKMGGDYSKIWHEHCANCFKPINKDTLEECSVSEDGLTWLCPQCYNDIFKK